MAAIVLATLLTRSVSEFNRPSGGLTLPPVVGDKVVKWKQKN